MESYHFLNSGFLEANDTKTKIELYLENDFFWEMQSRGATAEKMVLQRANLVSECDDLKDFLNFLNCFKTMLDHADKELREAFADSFIEEWCLLYLERYLLKHQKGRYYLVKMLREEMFKNQINVFYKPASPEQVKFPDPSKHLFNSNYHTADTLFTKKLVELFSYLQMTKVTRRTSHESFEKYLHLNLKQNLNETSYKYMEICLSKFSAKAEWTGNWYIFDLRLFAEAIQKAYENELKIKFQPTNPDSESDYDSESDSANEILYEKNEESHANVAFVAILLGLVHGDLQEWSQISKISFKNIVSEIHAIS